MGLSSNTCTLVQITGYHNRGTRLAILLLEELTKACMLLVVFLYLECSDEVPARLGDDRVLYPSSYM